MITARQEEILELIAHGLTNAEIADELQLATETIKSHVRNILAEMGARNRSHAVYLWLTDQKEERVVLSTAGRIDLT